MRTIYDVVTVAIFAGLIVLFMQRSVAVRPRDGMWRYLLAAAGCAAVNWLGNNGYTAAAIGCCAALLAFIFVFLRPFER